MDILRPNGSVERMGEHARKPGVLPRYGRDKEGSPKDARSWKIARDSDRRRHDRHPDTPTRGRLVDLNA